MLSGSDKKTMLHKVKESLGNISCLDTFINIDTKKEDIVAAGGS